MLERFPSPFLARRCWRPSADVYRTPSGWLVKLELAGVRPEDVRIQTQGRTLIISGVRRDQRLDVGTSCYSLEISYDAFERHIELPFLLANATITFAFESGMLLVQLKPAEGSVALGDTELPGSDTEVRWD